MITNINKNILVSVIIPIYMVERFLDECISSVVNQTYENLEIILIDDGSKDNCIEICRKWKKVDKRIVIVQKENAGLGYARNSGIENAHGEYICFVDSDDYIHKNMIEILLSNLIEEKVDTIFCRSYRFNEKKTWKLNELYDEKRIFHNDDIIKNILFYMMGVCNKDTKKRNFTMSVWHALYSKKIIDKFNLRFESEREIQNEDLFFHIDYLSRAKAVCCISDYLYFYRIRQNSLTTSNHCVDDIVKVNMIKNKYNLLKEKIEKFESPWEFDVYIYEYISKSIFSLISNIALDDFGKKKERIKNLLLDKKIKSAVSAYVPLKSEIYYRIVVRLIVKNHIRSCILFIKMNKIRKNILNRKV